MATRPGLPRGIGLNVHTVQIANFTTLFPWVSWVRIDGPNNAATLADWTPLVQYYQNLGLPVMWIADYISWGTSIVKHIRDAAALCKPDMIEICNEPSINGVTGDALAANCRLAKLALDGLTWRPLLAGPSLNSIAVDTGQFNAQWVSDFAAGNGHLHVDISTMHAYPNLWVDDPATHIGPAGTVVKTKWPGKPLVWTEYNPGPFAEANRAVANTNALLDIYGVTWPTVKLGNEAAWATASNLAAQIRYNAIAAAAARGEAFCMYDGPYNGNQYESLLLNGNAVASDQLTALTALHPEDLYT